MKYFSNIVTTILLSVLIISCSSDENQNNNEEKSISTEKDLNRNSPILPTEFGFYHNEAIILYLTELDESGREFSEQEISTAITEMAALMAAEYPSAFGDVNTDLILDYYSDYSYVEEYGYEVLKNNLIANFSNPEINSENFLTFIDEVFADENLTYEDILEKISLESDNSDEFIVFESILESSYLLWSSYPNYQSSSLRCSNGAIVVDAGIGALLWFTGPVGILGGAAGSLIYSDNCHNGNP